MLLIVYQIVKFLFLLTARRGYLQVEEVTAAKYLRELSATRERELQIQQRRVSSSSTAAATPTQSSDSSSAPVGKEAGLVLFAKLIRQRVFAEDRRHKFADTMMAEGIFEMPYSKLKKRVSLAPNLCDVLTSMRNDPDDIQKLKKAGNSKIQCH